MNIFPYRFVQFASGSDAELIMDFARSGRFFRVGGLDLVITGWETSWRGSTMFRFQEIYPVKFG